MKSIVVCHFVRKVSQLQASFIQNQILNHINYKPILIFKIKSNKRSGGFAKFDDEKIPILNLNKSSSLISIIKYKLFKKISKNDVTLINEFLKKNDVKVLHFHYGTDAGIYEPFLKRNEIPSVVSFYGYDSSGFPNRLFGYGRYYLKKRVFKYVTKVFAMSGDMFKDLIRIGCPLDKLLIHYYGSDVEKFSVNRKYQNKKVINFNIISGFTPQKGHIFLLKSFKKAFEINKNICLTIYGDGEYKENILKFIEENNYECVFYKGEVQYGSKEHIEALKSADVFIHPSITDINGDKEGIPGAVVEAMAAGLPVISTYHAGIPYIIENNKTGVLVKENDVEGLSDAILKLSNSPELRYELGISGQEYAINNLSLKNKEIELEDIYNSLS